MDRENLEINKDENWIKVKVDSNVFKPPHIVAAANGFTEDSWIVMDTDSEGDVFVKLLPKEEKSDQELREIGLNFQTSLVAKSVEMMKQGKARS